MQSLMMKMEIRILLSWKFQRLTGKKRKHSQEWETAET
jgi:hypothetical protein